MSTTPEERFNSEERVKDIRLIYTKQRAYRNEDDVNNGDIIIKISGVACTDSEEIRHDPENLSNSSKNCSATKVANINQSETDGSSESLKSELSAGSKMAVLIGFVLLSGLVIAGLITSIVFMNNLKTSRQTQDRDDFCEYKSNRKLCYSVVIHPTLNVNYTSAEEICKVRDSKIGIIFNEKIYFGVINMLRSKIPPGKSLVYAWIGMKINSRTGDVVFPETNVFVEWKGTSPSTGDHVSTFSRIYLTVVRNVSHAQDGMVNGPPRYKWNGVVCQRKNEDIT
ncbi:uncharacterized protein LOC120348677 [Styela clava]